jgi:Xaa-Pro dipeptidase
MTSYARRIQQLQTHLSPQQAVLLTQAPDLLYFTGFQVVTSNEREGFLVVTQKSATLFAAAFSPIPAYLSAQTPPDFITVHRTMNLIKIAVLIASTQVNELIIDETGIFFSEVKELQKALQEIKNNSLTTFSSLNRQWVWEQRTIKDNSEIELIRKAGQIIHQALEETLAALQKDQTEKEIANKLEQRLRELGADEPAFPTIVAFGEHATLPHHQPGNIPLSEETSVLIDCGAAVDGYNSDITRTVWFCKKVPAEFEKIKAIVDQAYQIGVDLLFQRQNRSEPLLASDIDRAVRSFIEEKGYGQYYIHTTGHGIGIDVHEPPSLYQTNNFVTHDGMVVTIEPGIYLPGKFGYRYENTFLLTSQGAEELTQ